MKLRYFGIAFALSLALACASSRDDQEAANRTDNAGSPPANGSPANGGQQTGSVKLHLLVRK